jgi:signal transduction histidine kinase
MSTLVELELAIETATTSFEKIRALNALAKELQNTDTPRAKTLAESALELIGETQDYTLEKANALLVLGWCHYLTSNYDVAMQESKDAHALFEQARDKKGIADSLGNIGNIYSVLADYPNTLKHFQESLNIRRDIGDKSGIASALNNIGNVYTRLADYPTAIKHYQDSLNIRRDIGDKSGIAGSLNNIGNVYKDFADYPEALKHYQDSLSISRDIGNKHSIAISLNNIGVVFYSLADYPEALKHYQDSLSISRDIGNKRSMAVNLMNIGQALVKLHEFEQAESHFQQALSFCDELGLKHHRFETLNSLTQLYAETRQFEKAYLTQIAFQKAKEAVFSEENQTQLTNLQVRFETEQSQKEAELYRLKNIDLVEANRFKTELLSLAAHDLKNPLQSIMGFAQLIHGDDATPQHLVEFAAIIIHASKNMNRLIIDLLDTAAMEQGKLTVKKTAVDLTKLAENLVAQYQPQASQKNQAIRFHTAETYVVQTDADKMQRILENLISNAVKYSPEGKAIWVSVKDVGGNIQIAVRDEGQGLTEADKEKLFQKFQRLSATPTGGESSTGLGLAIAKQLIELLGGSIRCESAGKNQGATFILDLPISS